MPTESKALEEESTPLGGVQTDSEALEGLSTESEALEEESTSLEGVPLDFAVLWEPNRQQE